MTDEALCDAVAFGTPLIDFIMYDYDSELRRRVQEYSFERIMSVCEYIGKMMNFAEIYFFTAKNFITYLIDRPDGPEIMRRFESENGFEIIGMPEYKNAYMQIAQKNSTN